MLPAFESGGRRGGIAVNLLAIPLLFARQHWHAGWLRRGLL